MDELTEIKLQIAALLHINDVGEIKRRIEAMALRIALDRMDKDGESQDSSGLGHGRYR